MKVPCKGCEYREVACHAKCPLYRMYKQKMGKAKEQELIRNNADAYVVDNVRKIRHRMRKAKYGCSVID